MNTYIANRNLPRLRLLAHRWFAVCARVCVAHIGPGLGWQESAAHRLLLICTRWNRRGGERAIPTIHIPSSPTWVTRGFTRSRSEAAERDDGCCAKSADHRRRGKWSGWEGPGSSCWNGFDECASGVGELSEMLGNSSDNPPAVRTRQAGLAAQQPATQETKGKSRRAMQSAGCRPNRREKSVRLTGRDKPCRQPTLSHPSPPALSRASWFAVGATLHESGASLFFWGPLFSFSVWSPREQTFGCESLVNPVIKPRTQDPGPKVTTTLLLPCLGPQGRGS